MRRSIVYVISLCALFTTLGSGCVFVSEDCDYVETTCWDVVDVYCDPWGCWEEVYTECEDYCVDRATAVVAPECTSDRHCASSQVCQDERCVSRPTTDEGAGLCESCDINADCAESGALCLNLSEGAEVGYCGRDCDSGGTCPTGFDCVALGDAGSQCVPTNRSCTGTDLPTDCSANSDCETDEICRAGSCVPAPVVDCSSDDDCDDGLVCESGTCVEDTTPECAANDDCEAGEECVDGACEAIVVDVCERNSDCGETDLCVDGSCRQLCGADEECEGDQVCRAGLCSPAPDPECATGTDCGEEGAFYCVNGTCQDACTTTEDCADGFLCRGFYCDVDPAVECRTTAECTGDLECVSGECLTPCATSCDCEAGLSCAESGYCEDLPAPDTCESDCDCPSGDACTENVCVAAG